ncbi:hypothetical protein Ait01nite_089590 [Actinoplanes italicus]|uniref:Uncharacterized protein n=1 Tax=Actinoplanes italicus TaxID=113567 RepID=A0A2T0JIE5_9ACTN|nr:DUF6221 family protein [Actinoplanes italicus]PRX07375.1 hypothetical protein CLV67_14250 [Actinoplanes italicus]GIE35914.1 hypothetical protein Ait01nite_089590 [Actinoplanes italicus]
MDDLNAFLRARLDEDEHRIRQAAEDYFYGDGHGDAVNRWFDRWSPQNPDGMLTEINAKRRMLEEAVRLERYDGQFEFLELLALPYAEHPNYRPEWRPVR